MDKKHGMPHCSQMINMPRHTPLTGTSCIVELTLLLDLSFVLLGIKVNLIEPGFISTDMTGGMSPERKKDISRNIPLGKFGTAEEVAKLVTFLAGGNTYITGQSIVIDGGLSL